MLLEWDLVIKKETKNKDERSAVRRRRSGFWSTIGYCAGTWPFFCFHRRRQWMHCWNKQYHNPLMRQSVGESWRRKAIEPSHKKLYPNGPTSGVWALMQINLRSCILCHITPNTSITRRIKPGTTDKEKDVPVGVYINTRLKPLQKRCDNPRGAIN